MTKNNSTHQTKSIQVVTFANADNLKMSSREIAKFTGKRHDHVMRDIVNMLSELSIHAPHFWGTYKTRNGNEYGCFNLPKRETLILISGYSAKVRAVIIDRWMELEKQASQIKASRLESKEVRKIETDAIKDLVEYAEASGSKSANMYYSNITRMTNNFLGIESGQRDNLSIKQLDQVRIAETMVKMAISDGLEQSLPYKEIYKLCKDRVSSIANVLLN